MAGTTCKLLFPLIKLEEQKNLGKVVDGGQDPP